MPQQPPDPSQSKAVTCCVTNDLVTDQRMHRICHTLATNGYAVELVGRKLPESSSTDERSFRQVRLRCRFRRGKLFYLEYNLRLLAYLLKGPRRTVCAVDLDTLFAATVAKWLRGHTLVFDAHEYFVEVPEVVGRPLTRWVWALVEKLGMPFTAARYTVGPCLAEELSARTGKPFGTVMNVPPKADVPVYQDKPVKFILYQGALNEGRGLEALIEAAEKLQVKVKIAGGGYLENALKEMVAQRGLQGRVEFLGTKKPEELRALTPQAWLGYNLLENKGKSYWLSLSNKFFDYIHAGVPSLSCNFPEYNGILKKYKVGLMANLEAAAIVKACEQLLAEPSTYRQMAENCQAAAEVFCWEKEEKKLLEIYAGV